MPNTLVDPVPIYPPDMISERFGFDSFSTMNCTPPEANSNLTLRHTINSARKREGSKASEDCVKRRDSFRNLDLVSNVPCESFNLQCKKVLVEETVCTNETDLPVNMELSDSSLADSGFNSSKSSSPVHDFDTICCLEKDLCTTEMEVDSTIAAINLEKQSITAAKDLHSLRLSDPSLVAREPLIPSLFKNVPPVIYFCTVDEPVHPMPEEIVPLLKWKLSTITPVVIKKIVQKIGFTLLEVDTKDNWIGTWGKHLKCATFKEIKGFQKVNHFPGGFQLGHKDRLWFNYRKMMSKYGEDEFDFFPQTYVLPADLKALKQAWGNSGKKCWIIKPCASARGAGVEVIHKWSQVPKNSPMVVQRYISDPYLINGSKFDLRIYVLISSFEPLRIYLFKDGLVRFASQKYSLANKSFSNRYIHLTNYSINRKSSSYTSNNDETLCQGHKWSLKSFWNYMSNSGIDVEKIQETIKDMVIKTIICTERRISRMLKIHAQRSYNCFELFGFDIMLDKNLHPWLLEVNISPSLHTKSKLDSNIKGQLIKDTLNIAGYEIPTRSPDSEDKSVFLKHVSNRHKPVHNRWLSPEERKKHALYSYKYSEDYDILKNLTLDDIQCLMESEDELQRCGEFQRVFPTDESHHYFQYIDHVRYYNVLLDAWERRYHLDRSEGVKLLQETHDNLMKSCSKSEEIPDLLKSPQESIEKAIDHPDES